jgi:streptogramin lyase
VVAALWVVFAVGAVASTVGTITEYTGGLNSGSFPGDLVAGTDGNVWFTDRGSTKAVGRVTPSGAITEYSTGLNSGSDPAVIVAGADGNVWFTDFGSTRAIGRVTPSGVITEYSTGLNSGSFPGSIVAGADGNIWFTDTNGVAVGRVGTGMPSEPSWV